MRSSYLTVAVLVLSSAVAGCGGPPPIVHKGAPPPAPAPAPAATVVETQTTMESVGLDAGALDRSANPCQDFYQFACGGWLAKTEIPGDEAAWVRSFSEIDKRNEEELRRILEEVGKAKERDEGGKKIGDFYSACMDEAGVEAAGTTAIDGLLKKARGVFDSKSLGGLLAELHARRIWALFDVDAVQDSKDATQVIAQIDQNGLGLPDRDYYTRDDEKSKRLRATYEAHVARMLRLVRVAGSEAAAKAAAADVMRVETEIAKISKTKVERRDPKGMYNKVERGALAKMAPEVPWDAYLKRLGLGEVKDLTVTSIPFVEGIGKLMRSVKAKEWRSYLAWHVVRATASALPKAFVDESFAMRAALTGQKDDRPRWKRCVDATDHALGELLGQAYVRSSFAGNSKPIADGMVVEIARAFANEVQGLTWMDDATKQRALAKLNAMARLIGYPNKWKTYDFDVDAKGYAKSVLEARAFRLKRDLAKIGKPLDRDEWQMSPPTVNAYYDPQRNHMVFPAGILQPPFFSAKAHTPVVFGGIGVVMGHELTHGFDDEGAQFDAKGNLEDWWSPKVGAAFKVKTACVETQYSGYEALPGVKVNGKLTLGENIADLGGLKLSFQAYRATRKGAAEVLVADGLTEDQQFFVAHGQAWCAKLRDETLRLLVQTNPHSPPRFRVNGPLSNLPEFGEAFKCAPGSPMRPAKTCSVW